MRPKIILHLKTLEYLWIKDDPRSEDLSDFCFYTEAEIYVATVRLHGVNLPNTVETYLSRRREEKQRLIEKAVERAELREVTLPTSSNETDRDRTDPEIDGDGDGGDGAERHAKDEIRTDDETSLTVGLTYGRCSQNEVAEALREQGADAAAIIAPSGTVSFRGSESFEQCHKVAEALGGGGHPKAAGCKPDIYDGMLDYAYHWTTRGAVAKQVILNTFTTIEG